MTTQQTFSLAVNHHQGGRLVEAEALYRQILAAEPQHAEAWHFLGVIAHQVGRHGVAVQLIQNAIAQNPNSPTAHSNLGEAYRALGRIPEAVASYRRALHLKPSYAEAHSNLGLALSANQQMDEAIAAYHRAIELRPNYPEAYNNLAAILAGRGEMDRAIAAFQRAIELKPDYAEAHYNLGLAFIQRGEWAPAADSFRRAIQFRPNYPEAANNLGNVLFEQNRLDDSVAAFRHALELKPEYAEALSNLGCALRKRGQIEDAVTASRRALALQPDRPESLLNLGNALKDQGELEEAERCYQRALSLNPGLLIGYNQLALTHLLKGEFATAEAGFRRAIACRPDFADSHFQLGSLLLLLGRYEEGWREYEWRSRVSWNTSGPHSFSGPEWDGSSAVGKTILVYAEQGFGDTLQFVRYLPLLKAHSGARHVIFACQPALVPFLDQLRGLGVEVIARSLADEELPPLDLHLPSLSLPLALQYFQPLPPIMPYLSADAAIRSKWRERMGSTEALSVGLAWAGNPLQSEDRRRSIAPDILAPILHVPGIRFISLQVQSPRRLPAVFAEVGVVDFGAEITDFSDSAALIEELDLIITVDTATAHLAGALGRLAWVLLPFVPHWPYGLERRNTPWYPTMRLFRQPSPGDWDSVVNQVAQELSRLQVSKLK